jgi:ketosteroid isomerase-like protein
MSAAENKATIQAGYEGFSRGDLSPVMSALADEVVWTSHGDPRAPTTGEFSGVPGVTKYFEALAGSADITKFEVLTVVAEGDTVFAMGHVDLSVKATGKQGSGPFVHVFGFADGKIATFDEFEHQEADLW